MIRVVAFNGSSRKDGNTAILLNMVLGELKKEDIETELIQLAGELFRVVSPAPDAEGIRIRNVRS